MSEGTWIGSGVIAEELQAAACQRAQGYYFARPQPSSAPLPVFLSPDEACAQ